MQKKPNLYAHLSDPQSGCDCFVLAPTSEKGETSHVH
jgi:hypothetical protein